MSTEEMIAELVKRGVLHPEEMGGYEPGPRKGRGQWVDFHRYVTEWKECRRL